MPTIRTGDKPQPLTPQYLRARATDAGNASMHAAKRTEWACSDFVTALQVMQRVAQTAVMGVKAEPRALWKKGP